MKQGNLAAECNVCSLNKFTANNVILTCSGHGCQVSVHQSCYGVLTPPKKHWFCRRCESQERAARVKCDLCPHKDGALKRTDTGGWCHVVCALYIPEVTFGCPNAMEPIILKGIPAERFNKICHICDENYRDGRVTTGACMPCNRHGCKLYFHVTCGQSLGLLREEPKGNGPSGPITYIGYCKMHSINQAPKQKKDARHFSSRSSSNSLSNPAPSSTPRPIPTPSPSLITTAPLNAASLDTTLQNGVVFNPVQLRVSEDESPRSSGNMGSKFTTANFVEATFESPPAAFNPSTSTTHLDAITLDQFSSAIRTNSGEISPIVAYQGKAGKKSPRSDKRTNLKSKFNNCEESIPKKKKVPTATLR